MVTLIIKKGGGFTDDERDKIMKLPGFTRATVNKGFPGAVIIHGQVPEDAIGEILKLSEFIYRITIPGDPSLPFPPKIENTSG